MQKRYSTWFAFGVFVSLTAVCACNGANEADDMSGENISNNVSNDGSGEACLPEGNEGLAAGYTGDVGIEKDPSVIFHEGFEKGKEVKDLYEGVWTDITTRDGKSLRFSDVVPDVGVGKRSMEITATRGESAGGHLFAMLPDGYDQMYARYYVRFAEDAGYTHHFVFMGATSEPHPWPTGGAGIRSEGDKEFSTGLEAMRGGGEVPPPGYWAFYSYWHQMRSYLNEDGTGDKCYGNTFEQKNKKLIPRGEWICVEWMMKANSSPDSYDGEMAFWIDGELIQWLRQGGGEKGVWLRDRFYTQGSWIENPQPFEGFNWRSTNDLKLNKFNLMLYVTEKAFKHTDEYSPNYPDMKINNKKLTVWFDDVVVATEYIGPIKERQ